MKAKIRYVVNGKGYEEEIFEIVLYDIEGKQAAYIYSTICDNLGFCIRNSKNKETLMMGEVREAT